MKFSCFFLVHLHMKFIWITSPRNLHRHSSFVNHNNLTVKFSKTIDCSPLFMACRILDSKMDAHQLLIYLLKSSFAFKTIHYDKFIFEIASYKSHCCSLALSYTIAHP